jgi:hypothetical protein
MSRAQSALLSAVTLSAVAESTEAQQAALERIPAVITAPTASRPPLHLPDSLPPFLMAFPCRRVKVPVGRLLNPSGMPGKSRSVRQNIHRGPYGPPRPILAAHDTVGTPLFLESGTDHSRSRKSAVPLAITSAGKGKTGCHGRNPYDFPIPFDKS